jgi:hypothetical protein
MENKIRVLIRGTFGNNDRQFAIHPMERRRAENCLNFAFYNQVPYEQLINYFIEYLTSLGCSALHIEYQINKIKKASFNPYNKLRTSSCWLISYEESFDFSKLEGRRELDSEKILNIVDARTRKNQIIDMMNFGVSSLHFGLHQKLVYQQRNSKYFRDKFSQTYGNYSDLVICEVGSLLICGRKVKHLSFIKKMSKDFVEFTEIPLDKEKN